MRLKHIKYEVISVDYSDIDTLIKEVYNQDYEFCADVEANNDSVHEYSIKKGVLDPHSVVELEDFKENGEYSFLISTLLKDMANRDIIEEGNYIIDVCW